MSIKSFVDTARFLYDNKKYNEALCLACIAIDACSANNYPEKNVTTRYKHFLKEHFRTICKYGFPGIEASSIRIKVNTPINSLKLDKDGYVDMEQIIYHTLRCGLVHDCNIEKTIEFTEDTIIGDWNTDKFYIPQKLIFGLIAAVEES